MTTPRRDKRGGRPHTRYGFPRKGLEPFLETSHQGIAVQKATVCAGQTTNHRQTTNYNDKISGRTDRQAMIQHERDSSWASYEEGFGPVLERGNDASHECGRKDTTISPDSD